MNLPIPQNGGYFLTHIIIRAHNLHLSKLPLPQNKWKPKYAAAQNNYFSP
jgi:hypothetical protein